MTSKIVEQGLDMKYFLEQLINSLHKELLKKLGIEGSEPDSEFTLEEIKKLIELLTRAHSELKYAILPQLPLELVIVEWSLQAQNNAEQNSEQRGQDFQHGSAYNSAGLSDKKQLNDQDALDVWKKLIEGAKRYNHSVAGVLRGCVLKSYDGKKLIIETGYKFHKERLEEKKTHEILEKVVEEIVGKKVKISVVLK